MRRHLTQIIGIAWTLAYAAFIIWLYASEPRTLSDVATGASVAAGTYEVDQARFAAAMQLFRREQYAAARAEWLRADPARRDAPTQFYIAYAFYREGWGKLYNDDELFRQGLEAVNRAISLAPDGAFVVNDPDLKMRTAVELKTELEQGLAKDLNDLNPLRVLRERR